VAMQTVFVQDSLSFDPPNVIINKGDTVRWDWTNHDTDGSPCSMNHSTTSDTQGGPNDWDSGVHTGPFTYEHTFSTAGIYPYYCKIHSSPGQDPATSMNGTVKVS